MRRALGFVLACALMVAILGIESTSRGVTLSPTGGDVRARTGGAAPSATLGADSGSMPGVAPGTLSAFRTSVDAVADGPGAAATIGLGAQRASVGFLGTNPWLQRRISPAARAAMSAGAREERAAATAAARRARARQRALAEARESAARALAVRSSGGLVVGDSVAMGAEQCLQPLGYEVDAEVGRQFADGLDQLRKYAAEGLPSTVVVHLGTNGPFYESDFRRAMSVLAPVRRVIWVTIALPDRAPYGFEPELNQLIVSLTSQYPNARVADWNADSVGHGDWFYGDKIHVAGAGCSGFADTVDAAVRSA